VNQQSLLDALTAAQDALELIASPMRADGTYNRDRRACELLAKAALEKVNALLSPSVPVGAVVASAAEPAQPASSSPYVVYSDGGCKGNPGPAGWGIVVLEGGSVSFAAGGYLGVQTNQIAELTAAIEGLSRVPEGAHVELVSDSQYTLKGISEWRAGWERKGWVNSAGQPVANQAYWKKLFALADKRKVKTRWVKGHNGDPLNERCDALANKAISAKAALVFED